MIPVSQFKNVHSHLIFHPSNPSGKIESIKDDKLIFDSLVAVHTHGWQIEKQTKSVERLRLDKRWLSIDGTCQTIGHLTSRK